MAKPTVGIVGASGETGKSIVNGLVEDGGFNIIALTRPASLNNSSNLALKGLGIDLRAIDIPNSTPETLATALRGIDILISAIGASAQLDQIALATAAKHAGVKRFLPCAFVPVIPPGIQDIRDQKEEVYNHVKRLGLAYTIVDVGWWYQIAFPALPSGKIDYAVAFPGSAIGGDGNVKSALTDLADVGRYVALVIKDERTVNKMVMVYNELWTQNEIWGKMEEMSGESVPRKYESREVLEARIAEGREELKGNLTGPTNQLAALKIIGSQYLISWGIRGDNTPEYAKYLGYLTSEELYPNFKPVKFEDYLQTVLDGKATTIYDEMAAQFKASMKAK